MTDEIAPPKKKGGRPKGSGLAQKLKELQAQIEALKGPPANPLVGGSVEELQKLHPQAAQPLVKPVGPKPALIPYKGWVKAKESCVYNTPHPLTGSRIGSLYERGDVFEVDVTALWTDDPFEAVVVTGAKEDGTPITEPNPDAPIPIDFRFRVLVDQAALNPLARAI
jgi:hypothetical protein